MLRSIQNECQSTVNNSNKIFEKRVQMDIKMIPKYHLELMTTIVNQNDLKNTINNKFSYVVQLNNSLSKVILKQLSL